MAKKKTKYDAEADKCLGIVAAVKMSAETALVFSVQSYNGSAPKLVLTERRLIKGGGFKTRRVKWEVEYFTNSGFVKAHEKAHKALAGRAAEFMAAVVPPKEKAVHAGEDLLAGIETG